MEQTILGLRTVVIKVPDLDAAKEWYADIFNTIPYFDQPFYVGFNIGGYELGLQPVEGTTPLPTDNICVYWGVEDIHAEYNRWLSFGATTHEAPQNVGGDIEVASVKDLWGNVLGLIYNPEFRLP